MASFGCYYSIILQHVFSSLLTWLRKRDSSLPKRGSCDLVALNSVCPAHLICSHVLLCLYIVITQWSIYPHSVFVHSSYRPWSSVTLKPSLVTNTKPSHGNPFTIALIILVQLKTVIALKACSHSHTSVHLWVLRRPWAGAHCGCVSVTQIIMGSPYLTEGTVWISQPRSWHNSLAQW